MLVFSIGFFCVSMFRFAEKDFYLPQKKDKFAPKVNKFKKLRKKSQKGKFMSSNERQSN